MKQTDTKAFRRWFGSSGVVDATGEPLRVYHGTASDFSAFLSGALSRGGHPSAELGFFFSEHPHIASLFSRDLTGSGPFAQSRLLPFAVGAAIKPVYLRIENPARWSAEKFKDMMGVDWDERERRLDPSEDQRWGFSRSPAEYRSVHSQLAEAGHDGVVIDADPRAYIGSGSDEFMGTTFVAFDPRQIKSAIGNIGNFDPADPNITRNPRRASKRSTSKRRTSRRVR